MIITVWLMTLLIGCAGKTVIGKPTCVKPVINVSTIENDRDILTVLNELTTLVEQQESTIQCYEKSFK
jgi:hypothetical protein